MSQVTIEMPEPVLRRFRNGARAAHMALEDFVAERLATTPVPLADELPETLRSELAPLEHLDDAALERVAAQQLSRSAQAEYDVLLAANGQRDLSRIERERLRELGDAARRLTLRRAHAYLILAWRGHPVPTENELVGTA